MNLYTVEKLKDLGITVQEAIHPRSKKLCVTVRIDNDWLVEQRAVYNNTWSSGDIVQEVFTSLFGYKSVEFWRGTIISIGESDGDTILNDLGEVIGILYYFNKQMVYNKK